jgi:hypothetical protein
MEGENKQRWEVYRRAAFQRSPRLLDTAAESVGYAKEPHDN